MSASDDQTLRIWDPASGKTLSTLDGHGEIVNTVAWSHDGQRIASGSLGKVLIWEAITGRKLRSLDGSCECLAWSPGDVKLVILDKKATYVRNVDTNGPSWQICLNNNMWRSTLALSPDGQWVAIPSQSDILIRDVRSGDLVKTLRGHKLPPYSMSFSPDGRQLASAGGEYSIHVWDLETGTESNVFRGQSGLISSVQWHPDGKRLASCGGDVRVWSTSRFNGDLEIRTANERTFALAWSPDGQRVATGGERGNIEIRDSESGTLLMSMVGHVSTTQSLAWHPTRPWLVSSGQDGHVRVWNSDTGQLFREMPRIAKESKVVAWSPTGDRLAVGGQTQDRKIILVNADTWEVAGKLPDVGEFVLSLDWSFDGGRLAGASSDGSVRVWDTSTLKLLKTLPALRGGQSTVAWSSKGDRLAAGQSYEIRVWETEHWKPIATLNGHTSMVNSLDWSPDDTRLISGSRMTAQRSCGI